MPSSAQKSGKVGLSSVKDHARPLRILAVDYGRKRIGLALSDELGVTARPLETLDRVNRRDDIRRLREICRRDGVARIVVGYPVHLNGEEGEMAAEAARFAARLQSALSIEVEMLDERLTTWEALQTVAETRPASRKKRRPLDEIAAAVLLREYLDRRRGSANPGVGEVQR